MNITESAPLLPIGFVAAHILEERITGFSNFFNREVLASPRPDQPVGKLEATLKDQVGLFVMLATLFTIGRSHPWALWVAVGFIAADSVQHLAYSIRFRRYTPGLATVALYVGSVVQAFRMAPENPNLMALAIGAGLLVLNFIFAKLRA